MSSINNIPFINIQTPTIRQYGGMQRNAPIFTQDRFATNPISNWYSDKEHLSELIKTNPRIIEILKENHIPLKINFQELENLNKGHLRDTRITAAKICSALPKEIKQEIRQEDIQQAAMLHDFGKILIPEKVLNKKDKLSDEERKIMELHSELGYEILKKQGIKPNVLQLVKYHHKLPDNKGYPNTGDDFEYSISHEILIAADKYSALREKRSYKEALSKEEALKILYGDIQSGYLSQEVYDALVKSA